MSKTFSFLITIDSKGNLTGKAFDKKDAQKGINEYVKARDAGLESYFYQHPVADKRCKSSQSTNDLAKMVNNTSPETSSFKAPVQPVKVEKPAENKVAKQFNPKVQPSDIAIDMD